MNYFHSVRLSEEPTDAFYACVFYKNELVVKITDNKAELPVIKDYFELNIISNRIHYLGRFNNLDCYAVEITDNSGIAKPYQLKNLRSLLPILDAESFSVAGKAFQILSWDINNKFCGRCGAETISKPDERAKVCPKCGLINYPHISPAVIVAVLKDGKILLENAKRLHSNMYTVLSGFLEAGETFEECIKREAKEEVAITVKNIKYFGNQPWPFPDSLMVAFTAEYESGEVTPDGDEILDAGWFAPNEIPQIPGKWSIARKLIDAFVEKSK